MLKYEHLGVWNECADVAEANDEESNCLAEEVEVVVVLPEDQIVASTEGEVNSSEELQQMQPDSSHKNTSCV